MDYNCQLGKCCKYTGFRVRNCAKKMQKIVPLFPQ